ncbi:hypothetical protein [Bradyrhizobium sp. SYSU BS000235]|uniref:hypothetical protein n=1 Tax=Bradyrhizobium sp. SYSU BS000235 TaxID=3411332 RepID=UPI003C773265
MADWKPPVGGPHQVAINAKLYESRKAEVGGFFGRELWQSTHYYSHDHNSYAVFAFADKAEADQFMRAFDGEPFDPRDAGSGSKWMYWFKGRAAAREKRRSPYDFRW